MKEMNLKINKMNDSVILPSKKIEDGGLDIYANFEDDYIIIEKGETKLIPTQLKSVFSSDYVVLLRERGSTGTQGMRLGAGVIDSGYRGEWFVPINNTSDKNLIIIKKDADLSELLTNVYTQDFLESISFNEFENLHIIYPYEKAICQALIVDNYDVNIEEVSENIINDSDSVRGKGKLGASGK